MQTCAGTSLRGQGDGGWEKNQSQRLKGVDVEGRRDAFVDGDKVE